MTWEGFSFILVLHRDFFYVAAKRWYKVTLFAEFICLFIWLALSRLEKRALTESHSLQTQKLIHDIDQCVSYRPL